MPEDSDAPESGPVTDGATSPPAGGDASTIPVEPSDTNPSDEAEPVELAESAEPPESVEPAEPAGSAEPDEPAEPGESAELAEPAESVEPVESAEPVEPVEHAESAEPTEATESAEPAELAEPTDTAETDPATVDAAATADDAGAVEAPDASAEKAAEVEEAVAAPEKRSVSLAKRVGLPVAVVVGVFVLVYVIDLLLTTGDVARDVTVVGVDVGGLSREEAEQRLHAELDPRLNNPVRLSDGEKIHALEPSAVGLAVDWRGTLDAATEQSLNPFTRIGSLFGTREIGVVSTADQPKLTEAIGRLRQTIDRKPVEGTIRFAGLDPEPVDPKVGLRLDPNAAEDAILRSWPAARPVDLPVAVVPVRTTPQSVRTALQNIAVPAVSGPVTVHGEGKDAILRPAAIARALTFEPDAEGALVPRFDQKVLTAALRPQLASTEDPGKNASFYFENRKPHIRPSEQGRGIDWKASFAELSTVVGKNGGAREITAVYDAQEPRLTTEQAKALGVKEIIGEFTTSGFAYDSGLNIRQVAREVHGAVVRPGQTFSLNGHTGPRGLEQGYVYAGVIKQGVPDRAVGGGISQFATTIYNASYFAGMVDVEHKEHSYYISRYPEAREATVFQNPDGSSVIDLKFRNDAKTGVVIQTIWTPSDITVRLWGTKRYKVESVNGGRFSYTSPSVRVGEPGNCVESAGAGGWSSSDTRILRDIKTGKVVRKESRTVVYNPQPAITCPEPEPEPDQGDGDDRGGESGNDSEQPSQAETPERTRASPPGRG